MKRYESIWLHQITLIIEFNIDNPSFQLCDITEELEISSAKLYRNVLKLTGLTPSKYIKKIRLEKAKEILEIGIYPTIKETSAAVGFKRPAYFSKLFYEAYQVLPSKILKGTIV